ncbi:bifunctional DNA-formamidopyrimidine glycosylase/DNA-(apurinic or apyrimidinic site) lyase [Amphibiibacter pelophylacis]|uniref:Bifunctional DNA-formamidopyrimidine glycosylase/DNA-(Apurinic or apyrimidinic site) lyase n=1 Tax=Amphibiibacter pelophylacis TaxID=1799477 RepID=A0ACC6P4X9_9BURK
MPELPEVEATRRSIAGPLKGRRIRAVALGKVLRWPLGCDPADLVGARLGAAQRRGKYIWLPLEDTQVAQDGRLHTRGGLLVHLGMSGALSLLEPRPDWPEGDLAAVQRERGPHVHVALWHDAGVLLYTDPRRFGAWLWSPGLDAPPASTRLAGLGHEPWDEALTPQRLRALWQGKSVAVKSALLSGQAIVGAGNIYACEALFRARIHPATPCGQLTLAQCTRLLFEVRGVLQQALDLGGTTLRNYSDALGQTGEFQFATTVYGREGLPCRVCARPVQRFVQQQRSTFFCAHCQKPYKPKVPR